MSARPIRILSHAGPALSGMIGDATNILFGSISSLPVDCRSSTYGAKVRPRVGGLVCKVYHHSKSAPAASQCNVKVICVCFQLSLRENVFGRPTRRRNYISTGQLFGIEYVATATTLILDSRRECRDKALARQALGSFFARSWLDFPFLFPHQLTKLMPVCLDRCCPFFAFPTYSCSCAQAMDKFNGNVWFQRCFHDPSFPLGSETKNCHVQGASSESFGGFKTLE